MKLLFDENLSESLCRLVSDLFPEARHVRSLGLQGSSDEEIWGVALGKGLTIVSKDSDFVERAIWSGLEVKVIWIRLGNCSTANVHLLIRNKARDIVDFLDSTDSVLQLP